MDYKIKINLDNAAFIEFPHVELSRILIALADDVIKQGRELCNIDIMDYNGNSCGSVEINN